MANIENITLWAEALESGRYQQIASILEDHNRAITLLTRVVERLEDRISVLETGEPYVFDP